MYLPEIKELIKEKSIKTVVLFGVEVLTNLEQQIPNFKVNYKI